MTLRDKAEIIAICVVAPVALELLTAARVLAWLRRVPKRRGDSPTPERLASGVDHVLRAARGPWRHTCLRRSVALAALLRRAGRDAEVVIGVRRTTPSQFEAHAWLRCDGVEPYLEPSEIESFAPLRPAGG